jgi:hypothetical protein
MKSRKSNNCWEQNGPSGADIFPAAGKGGEGRKKKKKE